MELYYRTFISLCRVRPTIQPYPLRDAGPDADRCLSILAGITDYNWLRLSVYHRGMSNRHHPSHSAAGYHNGDGDLYHRDLSCQGKPKAAAVIKAKTTRVFAMIHI